MTDDFDEVERDRTWRERLSAMLERCGGDTGQFVREVAQCLTLRDREVARLKWLTPPSRPRRML